MTETEARTEATRLRALHDSGILASPGSAVLDGICAEAKRHFDIPLAFVTLVDHEEQVIKAPREDQALRVPRPAAFCDHTIRSDEVLVVPDAARDPRFAANPLVVGAPFFRFYAGAPLVYRREIRLGSLCLLDHKPRSFSIGDRAELTLMAEDAVRAIAEEVLARRSRRLGL